MATITEVSVSFALTRAPKAPIHDRVPYMVDPRYAYTERAIKGLVEDVPEWVDDPKTNNLKFEYVLPAQRIECVYHKTKCILTCFKIKFCNYSSFLGESTLFEILETKQNGIVNTKYKAVGTLTLRKPWNKNIFADLITNDPRIANSAAMCEKSSTLNERRMVSMTVQGNSRITIAESPQGKVVAMMSKLSDTEEPAIIMSALREILDIYDDRYDELTAVYVDEKRTVREAHVHPVVPLTGIKLLRSNLPELFVNNYTRECPMLPIMISKKEAISTSVICYPKDGVHKRYYTAPEGYHVGLKKNRLKNKDLFPYLVTCYLSDHMTREGSETHKYYFGGEIKSRTKSNRPIPKFITNKNAGYHRKRADPPSFVVALERATGRAIDRSNMPWCPQVTKQELWDKKDNDIMDAILSADNNVCGSSVYRYFENLMNVSIHVVVIANGTFDNVLPRHKGTYVWSAPHPRHVILFENYKTTYGVTSCYYDILVGQDDNGVFDDDDPIVSSLVEEKKSMSVPPTNVEDVAHQLIDSKGKCRLVVRHDGSSVDTYTRPFDVPTIAEPACFFDEHVRKLNVAKVRMGLPVIDLSKRSTETIKYFPNNSSYRSWKDNKRLRNERSSHASFLDTTDGLRVCPTTTHIT